MTWGSHEDRHYAMRARADRVMGAYLIIAAWAFAAVIATRYMWLRRDGRPVVAGSSDVEALIARMENEIRPLIHIETMDGGYDCCGHHSTHDEILDHAERLVREAGVATSH